MPHHIRCHDPCSLNLGSCSYWSVAEQRWGLRRADLRAPILQFALAREATTLALLSGLVVQPPRVTGVLEPGARRQSMTDSKRVRISKREGALVRRKTASVFAVDP